MRHGKKLDDGRKLRQNRPKPSPFVRLTFGEKHEIANFMKENPGMQLKQYAEMFTKKWNRNVTERFFYDICMNYYIFIILARKFSF